MIEEAIKRIGIDNTSIRDELLNMYIKGFEEGYKKCKLR